MLHRCTNHLILVKAVFYQYFNRCLWLQKWEWKQISTVTCSSSGFMGCDVSFLLLSEHITYSNTPCDYYMYIEMLTLQISTNLYTLSTEVFRKFIIFLSSSTLFYLKWNTLAHYSTETWQAADVVWTSLYHLKACRIVCQMVINNNNMVLSRLWGNWQAEWSKF